ncbi:ChaC, cation transport regulator homolog [Seminavis robusta]|uniref:PRA1 family protein n=1 Tax=Seminavis robusta TaxID=568900 RepID=A0A9N8HK91_9STRA|nr:ChaC, cation transport regulator homolog [Seminavis robusta]|eukprot:Sro601_g173440.1 ChaC, cation transport regulator homolog (232) ;mRNA; f:2545-3674
MATAAPAAGNAAASILGLMGSVKEKWESSGASRAVSDVYAQVPQGTKDYFSAASQQLFSRQHLRPVSVVFGIGEERPFYVERAGTLLVERVRHNLSFFYLNYMLLMAVLFTLTLVISPTAIIGIGLLGAAWIYMIRSATNGHIKIGAIDIQQKHATIAMSIISVIVLFWLLQKIFWWTLFSSGFLILAHALFRDASLHKDSEDQVDMQGEMTLAPTSTGEDAAFLKNNDLA